MREEINWGASLNWWLNHQPFSHGRKVIKDLDEKIFKYEKNVNGTSFSANKSECFRQLLSQFKQLLIFDF